VLLAVGAVEFLGVLGDGIENEQMGRHGLYLSVRVSFHERDIGGWFICVGYGIRTVASAVAVAAI
jgi:hypothetical protein